MSAKDVAWQRQIRGGVAVVTGEHTTGLLHAGPTLGVDVISDQLSIGYKPAFLTRTDFGAMGMSNTLRFGLNDEIIPLDVRYDVLWDDGQTEHVLRVMIGCNFAALIDSV